ncbi:DUF6445 family protein [Sphingomonas sp. HITSZ_GF]|uniref:DUF6445 family protein n=1 Tax=Sphingomonas sp. HITSZ_GF TaxID=3037247 RepID=UPI00240CEA2F|nr:DUF6445 family protein [Sphingomonas sp. HITSZ_GF]MDG2535348.1 DUF6445 family protein [Sphingomonas sp. HITSZ_GF]
MKPARFHIGTSRSPVVTIDGFADPAPWIALAAEMAPFPSSKGTYYPGLRRVIGATDVAAWEMTAQLLEGAAPFIGGGFDFEGFDLIEASFSMVTAQPETLDPAQRAPHFDSTDPAYLALLLYLNETPGTAFYRQRATGIEAVNAENLPVFIEAAKRESAGLSGYTAGSNAHFEQIGAVAGHAGRLALYQGRLLHSGIIPATQDFSADPRVGRLTLNLFVRGKR